MSDEKTTPAAEQETPPVDQPVATPAPEPTQTTVATGFSIVATGTDGQVRRETEEMDTPEYNSTVAESQRDRAKLQVKAGTPLPVDPSEARSDDYLLRGLKDRDTRITSQREIVATKTKDFHTVREKRAGLPQPMPLYVRLLIVVGVLFVLPWLILGVRDLLYSSLDELILKGYFAARGYARTTMSNQEAKRTALECAGALFIAETMAVLLVSWWVRFGRLGKIVFVGIAVLFSGGFGLLRMSADMNAPSFVITMFELALVLAHSALLCWVAECFFQNGERAHAYAVAGAGVTLAQTELITEKDELRALEQEQQEQLKSLALREDSARRMPAYQELAAKTVETAALVATAKVINKHVQAAYTDEAQGKAKAAVGDVAEHAPPSRDIPGSVQSHVVGGAS